MITDDTQNPFTYLFVVVLKHRQVQLLDVGPVSGDFNLLTLGHPDELQLGGSDECDEGILNLSLL